MPQEQEPSVEEILESIKKVINRDGQPSVPETRRRREPKVDVVADEPSKPEETEQVLDLDEMEITDEEWPEEEQAEADGGEAPLITESVRGAMQENLAALAMLAEPGARPQIVRSGETSLEGLTRELLRPMLAQWLDDNLPEMVEKLVQAEITRIAGKRR